MLIHIGGPKTASTSLQKGLFAREESILHFGEYGDGRTTLQEYNLLRSFLSVDRYLLKENKLDEIQKMINQKKHLALNKKFVFSSADILEFQRPEVISSDLANLFGKDNQILLVIRNQIDALVSYYVGHGAWLRNVPKPHFRRYVTFSNWLEYQLKEYFGSHLHTFSYWEQLNPFIDIFGKNNISVVCFEDLISGDMASWAKIGTLIEVNPRRCFEQFSNSHERARVSSLRFMTGVLRGQQPFQVLRQRNIVDYKIAKSLEGAFASYKPKVEEESLHKIIEYFRESNKKIQEHFDLDLTHLNYPT